MLSSVGNLIEKESTANDLKPLALGVTGGHTGILGLLLERPMVQQAIVDEFTTVPSGDALYMPESGQPEGHSLLGAGALRVIVALMGDQLPNSKAYKDWLACH